jgi:hypothetical protein
MPNLPNFEDVIRDVPDRLLSVDPGHTTGYALWVRGKLTGFGQLSTLERPLVLRDLVQRRKPTYVVFEAYQIYSWKLDQHAFSDVPTLRLIGALELICLERDIPYSSLTAQQSKSFVTDEKLKAWSMFQTSTKRHANDAIRLGAHFLIFGPNDARPLNKLSRTVG